MFESIAPTYDAFNHLSTLGIDRVWRKRALRWIDGPQVLDVACGTGDFSILIAQRRRCGVIGVDISEKMLSEMKRKVLEEHVEREVNCEIGDCAALRFKTGTFDNVTVAFGVRNFEDREACLKEILRVLRPGGKFVMLELGMPRIKWIRKVYQWYFTRVMPLLGSRLSGNRAAYEYLHASVRAFPGPKEWVAILRGAGFSDVKHRAYSFGVCRLFVGTKA